MVHPPFPAKGIPIPLHLRDPVLIIHSKKNAYNSLPSSCFSSHFISTLVLKLETPLGMFCRIRLAVGAWSAAGLLTRAAGCSYIRPCSRKTCILSSHCELLQVPVVGVAKWRMNCKACS